VKLMGSAGRDVHRLAGAEGRLPAAESGFHLAFEQDKGFLEVMAVRRASFSVRFEFTQF
jgi:hypothetical protein